MYYNIDYDNKQDVINFLNKTRDLMTTLNHWGLDQALLEAICVVRYYRLHIKLPEYNENVVKSKSLLDFNSPFFAAITKIKFFGRNQ